MSAPLPRADATAASYRESEPVSPDSTARRVVFRATIWGVFGLIYAPLFVGLVALLKGLGAGTWSYAWAAGIVGGVTAVLYGGRQVGLVGAGVGLGVGALLLFAWSDSVPLEVGVAVAMGVALLIGLLRAFPGRCADHVPGKAVAGALAGLFGGLVVSIAEPLHPQAFDPFVVLAFLVSVNGVLYVGSLRRVVRLSDCVRWRVRRCNLAELLVIVIMAGFTAGSLWVVAGPFLGGSTDLVRLASDAIYQQAPAAIPGAVYGGALAGALLELFRFRWIYDL
jgi:hypothetical protein